MDKDDAAIKEMSTQVVAMEKKYDYSMRGVFLERLVTEYVQIMSKDLIMMFEYIMEHQKDDHGSYGDFDVTINKLKFTTNTIPHKYCPEDFVSTPSGIFVSDNPACDNFMCNVIKVENVHNEFEGLNQTDYYLTYTQKNPKKLDFDKVKGDWETQIVTLEKEEIV